MKGEGKREFEIQKQSGGLEQSIGVPEKRAMGVEKGVSGKRFSRLNKVARPLPIVRREFDSKSVPFEGEVFVF
jgi:hypothetical protein